MKIILINGFAQSGKDTFVQLCQKELRYGTIENISTVDLIKKAAFLLGWNGVKDDKGRKFLSDLKDTANLYSDLSSKYIKETIENSIKLNKTKYETKAIFVHAREPEEIDKLKKEFNAITLLIRNNRIEPVISNHADRNVENYKYDYIVNNNGSILDLTKEAVKFMKEVGILSA